MTSLTDGHFKGIPLKVSESYFVGVAQFIVQLPTGTFLKRNVTAVIFVSGLIP